ncbi:2-keto-4-pentenoate hydratase [Rhodopila sp.]|uniref:2-keto-4-pentenoate hydratase n=1 Tax=Rhodopila sp. TaxID=2480087 RepID=UPI003D0F4849
MFDPLPAARLLQRLRQDRTPLTRLPAAIAPASAAEGSAVQAALAALMDAVPPVGFKIGATGKRMQAYLGVNAPIAGFIRHADLHRHQATLRFDDFIKPGVECEVAVRLARDVPPGPCSLPQALAAVGDFFAGIEIVDNRYGDLAELGMPTLLADQMYHGAAVISDRHDIDWHGLPIEALCGRIWLDDGTTDEGITSDLLGHPLNGLAWLAGSAEAAAFGGLKAGQVVMLGSVTPPLWLRAPATVTVAFPPLPPVTVRWQP